jgi:HEAT repeat protein
MPIVPSRAGRVRALVEQLASERSAERDSAVAQLTLLGPRVVEPLVASLVGASAKTRLAALEVLEGLEDRRAFSALLTLTGDPSRAVALGAIEQVGHRPDPRSVATLAGILVEGTPQRRRAAVQALAEQHRAGLVEALDPLLDTVVDEEGETELRLAVLDALGRIEPPLPRSTLGPLGRRLASSRDAAVARRAAVLDRARARRASTRPGPEDLVERLASGTVSEDEARKAAAGLRREDESTIERLHEALEGAARPRAVRALAAALGTVGGPPAIPALSRALARVTESAPPGGDPAGDLETRAALHEALAALDSGIALHDLRELIARHPPGVTPRLLDAAARVGNASLVPALAQAASEDPVLLERCTATYTAIARREKLRRSSAALRRVRAEHRPALESFLTARAGGRR